jgi:hypothetical protein
LANRLSEIKGGSSSGRPPFSNFKFRVSNVEFRISIFQFPVLISLSGLGARLAVPDKGDASPG